MPRKLFLTTIMFTGLSGLGQACSPAPQSEISQSNFIGIQSLLLGDYIGMTRSGEVYHSIIKLQVTQFGGNILYHHISRESLGGAAEQRKIYAFNENGTEMRSTVLRGRGEVIVDEQTMVHKLDGLTEGDLLRFPDGCQFQWQKTDDGFVANVHRNKCSYESPAFGGVVRPDVEYRLSPCGLGISEGFFREDDSPVFPPSAIMNRRVNPKTNECHETIQ